MNCAAKRSGNKWNVNELLALQREYELLEWTIQEIAEKHERSEYAILFKLESEGFIDSWDKARGFSSNLNYEEEDDEQDCCSEEEEEEEEEDCCGEENYCESKINKLARRMSNLEKNLNQVTDAVNKLCENIIFNKKTNKTL